MRGLRGLLAFMSRHSLPVVVGLATIGFGAAVQTGTRAAAVAETTVAYYYTGTEQAFTVPAGVTSLHVVAVGARGGRGGSSGAAAGGPGGYGATVTADIPVVPGTMLYVEVGGSGADAPNASSGIVIGGVGGFNNEAGS